MEEAVEDGVELIGYTVWGCTDLVSAGTGEMAKRYGLVYVDKDNEGKGTLERRRKDSFFWYQKVKSVWEPAPFSSINITILRKRERKHF